MFFTLILVVIFATYGLAVFQNRCTSANYKLIKFTLYTTIVVSVFFICSHLATVGLVFNIKNPDIDFSSTINYSYMTILTVNIFIYATIIALFLFTSRKLNIRTYWLFILVLIAAIVIYYPGIPSADGDNSYNQYLTQHYSDWQPPLFTIWWILFSFKGATFLIDSLAYYLGLAYISYYLEQKNYKIQSNILFIFSINPILFSQLAIIWKDIGYTAFLIDLVAIYLALDVIKHKLTRRVLWCAYYLCIFLTISFRANGVFAVLPFIYLSTSKMIQDNKFRYKLYNFSLSIVILIGILALNQFITYKILHAERTYPQENVTLSDTAYINCQLKDTTEINEIFFNHLNVDDNDTVCSQALNYYNMDSLFNDWNNWGIPYKAPLKVVATKDANTLATHQWIEAVINNPGTYMEIKAKIFINILFNQYWYPASSDSSVQSLLNSVSQYQHKDMKFLFPLLIIISLTFIFGMYWAKNISSIAIIITLSSILQLFGWFFLLPAHPARYFFWNDIAAILSLLLISADKIPHEQLTKTNVLSDSKNFNNQKFKNKKTKNVK